MRFPVLLLTVTGAALAQCPGDQPVALAIPAVQGAGDRSRCEGKLVAVSGVVTAALPGLSGFFLQDPAGDGDPGTSDGVFVFTGSRANLPAPGTLLRVTARAVEFARQGRPGSVTELDLRVAEARLESLGAAPPPAPVGLDLPLDGAAYLEAREGMLAAYPRATVVAPANEFGEALALRFDRLPERVRPTPGDPGTGGPLRLVRAGNAKVFDLVPPLTGVLHYDFGSFRLEPLADYAIDDTGLDRIPARATLASVNVQRLMETSDPRLDLFAAAIRDQLGSPALIGVQEAGTVEVLRALGARTGGYEAVLLEGCDFGGIDVGLLYQPARVRVLAARQLQTEAPEFRKPACTLPDGRRFSDPLLDRPSLRVDLELDGVPLTLVVNHWRSQIGGRDDQRLATARFLAAELAGIRNLVLLGDFNDTEDSEPVQALALTLGLVNLSDAVPPHRRYSLIFEGLSETLDHILMSSAMAARVQATGFAHYNADFPESQRTSDHDNPWAFLR